MFVFFFNFECETTDKHLPFLYKQNVNFFNDISKKQKKKKCVGERVNQQPKDLSIVYDMNIVLLLIS